MALPEGYGEPAYLLESGLYMAPVSCWDEVFLCGSIVGRVVERPVDSGITAEINLFIYFGLKPLFDRARTLNAADERPCRVGILSIYRYRWSGHLYIYNEI